MTPIRVEETGVEPLSLPEMRAYLRLSSDETAEDALIARLITAARAAVEAAACCGPPASEWCCRPGPSSACCHCH